MNFKEYKKQKMLTEAYQEAQKIQEDFALSALSLGSSVPKQYEGYMSVNDIIGKIEAMTRMFENLVKDNTYSNSAQKIMNIIDNLYDLAQIKLVEAKKQARDYMQKSAGVSSFDEPSAVPEEEPALAEPKPSFAHRPLTGGAPTSMDRPGPTPSMSREEEPEPNMEDGDSEEDSEV